MLCAWAECVLCDQAYVVEDNKQLILEGQLHVALQTIGKEASSLIPKEVRPQSSCLSTAQWMLADLRVPDSCPILFHWLCVWCFTSHPMWGKTFIHLMQWFPKIFWGPLWITIKSPQNRKKESTGHTNHLYNKTLLCNCFLFFPIHPYGFPRPSCIGTVPHTFGTTDL